MDITDSQFVDIFRDCVNSLQPKEGFRVIYDVDKWCASDTSILEHWAIRDGYIKDNFDNVYPITSIISFSWSYWEKWEIEYCIDEIDFCIPSFPSEKYIERIRVKGCDTNR